MPGFEIFGDEECREVDAVMQTGILARYGFEEARNGVWKALELEQEICKQFGSSYTQLLSSGTAALTTVLAALNVGAGHEVILPVFCDVSCVEAIITIGAIPVFADIDETLTMSPHSLKKLMTPSTRAVLLVHAVGSVANITAIKDLCESQHVFLLEDSSQAIGAFMNGRSVGTFGSAGVLSFDFHSTITCGEGGAVITDDANLFKLCNEYSDHGHEHLSENRNSDGHRYMGTNYRLSELHAAVGLAQMKKLPTIIAQQRRLHQTLRTELESVSSVAFKNITLGAEDSCTHLTILLPSQIITQEVVAALEENEIPFAYWYDSKWHYIRKWEHFKNGSWMNRLYDDHKRHILQHTNLAFPASDIIMNRCISFAISLRWTEAEATQRGRKLAIIIQSVLVKEETPE
ncbi:MAG TPA: DegT/DnrJ/EryC1/StrS family aminotransferase [Flavipsychrobacter sp.]|nr:DegT/DnrJ/EryC1/StrS family aminotransferase [Flavipsychrobacter sp.]